MEQQLWNYLSGLLPDDGQYTRIESHDTAAGFPDVHYMLAGVEGTIELKDSHHPTATYPFATGGLRDAQKNWLRDYLYSGGRPLVCARVGDPIYFIEGATALRLNSFRQEEFSLFATLVVVPRQRARSREKLHDLLVKKLTFSNRSVID
jgi:hypothetical protein